MKRHKINYVQLTISFYIINACQRYYMSREFTKCQASNINILYLTRQMGEILEVIFKLYCVLISKADRN